MSGSMVSSADGAPVDMAPEARRSSQASAAPSCAVVPAGVWVRRSCEGTHLDYVGVSEPQHPAVTGQISGTAPVNYPPLLS